MLRVLFFVLVVFTVLGLGHLYLWKRLVRDAQLSPRWRLGLTIALLVLTFSVPATLFASRELPRESMTSVAFGAFIWMGLLSMYFVLLLVTEFCRQSLRAFRTFQMRIRNTKDGGDHAGFLADPERRKTLGRILSGGVVAAGTAVGGVAMQGALKQFSLKKLEISLDRLPSSFDGLRIVQLTDVHVGPTIGRDFVEKMVDAANSLSPDIVALTGDFVDGSVAHLGHHTAPLAELRATLGTFFVTGNHEYYSGVEEWLAEFERLGINTLRNRSQRFHRGNDSFLLAGVSDYRGGRYGDAPDLKLALKGRKSLEEVILLAHQPREVFRAQEEEVGLQLSGHTHGGQFWPWNWAIHLIEPVVSGLARFGRTQIYVSSGTGYWGPPMRLGTEAEITLIVLRSKLANPGFGSALSSNSETTASPQSRV